MTFDPAEYLAKLGDLPDEDIDLGKAALALSAADKHGIAIDRYVNHLKKLSDETAKFHAELLDAGAADDAETRLAALKRAVVESGGYKGDVETYDDLQNANLLRVIDRGKGQPIALAILYIGAGRAQGWDVCGLDFPGHFLCRIEKDGRRLIFDPFYDCKILGAPELRNLVKTIKGKHAELSSTYFEPTKNRDILIRLQNNIKYRQIDAEDYEGALKTVEAMRRIDPGEFRLLLDAGVLYARTNRVKKAIDALEDYIKQAPNDRDRHEAAVLLRELMQLPH